jgi:nucleoside-diphosphate-sugar epimerase
MRILITGGTGFIGGHLIKALSLAHTVDAPCRKQLDLTNPSSVCDFFSSRYYHVVIHAAGTARDQVHSRDPQIAQTILTMFDAIHANRSNFHQLINLGSGAEFGLDRSCVEKKEQDIYRQWPRESYGLAKNIIARTVADYDGYHNVRIFGCAAANEAPQRLFKKFHTSAVNHQPFVINDRSFDMIGIHDLVLILQCIIDGIITDSDINAVYPCKMTLSQLLFDFCYENDLDHKLIKLADPNPLHYTGCGAKLEKYQLNLHGLAHTMREYSNA